MELQSGMVAILWLINVRVNDCPTYVQLILIHFTTD